MRRTVTIIMTGTSIMIGIIATGEAITTILTKTIINGTNTSSERGGSTGTSNTTITLIGIARQTRSAHHTGGGAIAIRTTL